MLKTTKFLFFAIAICLSFSTVSIAQKSKGASTNQKGKNKQADITLSEVFKERMLLPNIVASDSSFVIFRPNFRKGWVRSYDIATKKLSPKFKITTALKEAGNRGRSTVAVMVHEGNLVYITQDFSKENDLLTLFYSVISRDGQVISPAKDFMTISSKKERE